MTSASSQISEHATLAGQRVAVVGKLTGMTKREAQQFIRQHGGVALERCDDSATLVVVGEQGQSRGDVPLAESLDPQLREAVERGATVLDESGFCERLGLVDRQHQVHSLYTSAMLARLLGSSVSTVRRWQRRGWLVPVREVRKLAYFDFQEVATARRLKELLAAGMSHAEIEKTLAVLARNLPDVKRPLAELSVMVEGRQLLLRQGEGLVEPTGQLRFDFGSEDSSPHVTELPRVASDILAFPPAALPPASPGEMVQAAGQLEDEGDLAGAAEMYRAALVAGGPKAEICFLLAELLYQQHDLSAARERYYMAIELDEDYVEARANLGCVLAEQGEHELAACAFRGALAYHDDYADVHYHLGRTLDVLGRADEAVEHWQAFLRLAPDSPWADEAHERVDV